MREFFIGQNTESYDWLIFLGVWLLIGIPAAIFLMWLKAFHKIKRNRHKRGRRRHRHPDTQKPGSAASASRPARDRVPPPAR